MVGKLEKQRSAADVLIGKSVTAYRKAKPGTSYAEAFRALCFDEPWASELQVGLAALKSPGGE